MCNLPAPIGNYGRTADWLTNGYEGSYNFLFEKLYYFFHIPYIYTVGNAIYVISSSQLTKVLNTAY